MRLPQDRILHIDTEIVDGKVNVTAEWQGELVRCKDCRWYEQKQKHLPYNVSKRYCNRSCVLATKENDFCSYGERKGGDDE